MKTTIIYLGIVAMTFITKSNAAEFKFQDLNEQEVTTINLENIQQDSAMVSVNELSKKSFDINTDDAAIFNPNSVLETNYSKSATEIIAENKLVIDNKEEEYKPLSIETRLEDKINEDNQIIESQISNEEYPLDFEKINRSIECVKVYNNNATITIDLKL